MVEQVKYSPRERFSLWTLAVFGFLTVNGAFGYGLFRTGVLNDADNRAGSSTPDRVPYECPKRGLGVSVGKPGNTSKYCSTIV